jgi:hypothetical protein
MPLQSVLNGAKQCQVLTKRGKERCKNPAAYGCKSCRMHGAHKSRNVLRGVDHPQFRHGNRTKEAQQNNSEALTRIRMLEQIGRHIKMFVGSQTRGRKPNGYMKLNLNNPLHMVIAIIKIID